MGAGNVTELGGAVLDPASGSALVGGPRMLTQREEGGPRLPAAQALGTGTRHAPVVTHRSRHRVPAVTHLSRSESIQCLKLS